MECSLNLDLADQIIATSHDLTPKGSWGKEISLFQGNLGWWNIIIWNLARSLPWLCMLWLQHIEIEWCVSGVFEVLPDQLELGTHVGSCTHRWADCLWRCCTLYAAGYCGAGPTYYSEVLHLKPAEASKRDETSTKFLESKLVRFLWQRFASDATRFPAWMHSRPSTIWWPRTSWAW